MEQSSSSGVFSSLAVTVTATRLLAPSEVTVRLENRESVSMKFAPAFSNFLTDFSMYSKMRFADSPFTAIFSSSCLGNETLEIKIPRIFLERFLHRQS